MSKYLDRVQEFFRRGLWRDRPAASRLGTLALQATRITALSVRGFLSGHCLMRATALAYTTLLSLVPLLALAFALAKGFGVQEQIRPMVDKWLAANQAEVGDRLVEFIEKTNDYVRNTSVGVLGALGLVFLVWTTISVLGTIEESFNEIWGVRRSRTLLRKFTDYLSVLVISPVLLVAATGAGAVFRSTAIVRSVLSFAILARVVELALVLVPTWAAFAAVYLFMPNTKVKLRAALAGGIVAGTVWQGAFWLYTTFQVGMSNYNAIYGTFAALPVFMVWLYLGWMIVLFGAEISWATQNARLVWEDERTAAASFASREAVALRAMVSLALAFHREGAALTAEQIAERTRGPLGLIRDVVRTLASAGLCSEVVRPGGSAFQPARPLEKLTPADVLAAVGEQGEAVGTWGDGPEAALVAEVLASRGGLAAASVGSFRDIVLRLGASGTSG